MCCLSDRQTADVDWLNYHHLFYFWTIAQEGGLAAAARKLRLTHSTLSAQLRSLEDHFGVPLFERRGKRLVLTPFGLEAASFAADIFRLGRELNDRAQGRPTVGREVLRVGVVPALPKTLVSRLLAPALDAHPGGVWVRQDSLEELIASLVAGRLHLMLTNELPATPPGARVHAHVLGETEILLYARSPLARAARRAFPRSLATTPFVLPPVEAPLRKRLDVWFAEQDVRIMSKVEVDDAGLLRALGIAGRGVFPVRSALKAEVDDLRDVSLVGPCEGVQERYYAITTDRRLKHPAVVALVEKARARLEGEARGVGRTARRPRAP